MDYCKPHIAIGNYYLDWDDSSQGIPHVEESRLKSFLKDIVPYLTPVIHEAASEMQRIIENKLERARARYIQDAYSPEVLLTRRMGGRDKVVYVLHMKRDGTTLISRSEVLLVSGTSQYGSDETIKERKAEIRLTWPLGELLFYRQQK